MATDITKTNFDPLKHYTSVRMQQGRVLIDDDWNENEQIENEDRRRALVDIIGPFGSPDDGFKIISTQEDNQVSVQGGRINFQIQAGTLYLGGLRLEMDEPEQFRAQTDWLQMPSGHGIAPADGLPRYDLVYLEAWQQTVTAVEDKTLLEVALGGPDTTTRVRNMRRVKIIPGASTGTCATGWNALKASLGTIQKHELQTDAMLKVGLTASGLSDDLCSPTAMGGYLGAQNQTIRIQLTSPTAFTWGFDNASTLYKAEVLPGNKFKLISTPKDNYHYPKPGKIVEVIPCSAQLPNGEKIAELSGTFHKVTGINSGEYTFNGVAVTPSTEVYIRLWDRGEDLESDAEIQITPNVELKKTGLQVTFTGDRKRKDDYWIISVRPEASDAIIPKAAESGIAPNGVRRYYAPLAVIRWDRSGDSMVGTIIHDCRKTFLPLTERRGHCEHITPGQDIQAVIDKYDEGEDICICFQNGEYVLRDTVNILNKGHIKFTGCGKGSKIIVEQSEAAFKFEGCKDITIRDLSVESQASGHPNNETDQVPNDTFRKSLKGGITVIGCEHVLFENIQVTCTDVRFKKEDPKPKREASCVYVMNNDTAISIKNSEFNIGLRQAGILVVNPNKVLLENNRLSSAILANQGIVIAGRYANEVHIKDNTILNVEQGIHIGTSNNKDQKDRDKKTGYRIDRSTSVLITGNRVTCILLAPDGSLRRKRREGHGIFVGNCDSLILRDNFIKLSDIIKTSMFRMNGIRIYGYFGKRIIVRDNHLDGFGYKIISNKDNRTILGKNLGIYIVYRNPNVEDPKWWIVEANVTEDLRIKGVGKFFRTAKMVYADGWRKSF